MQMNTLASPRRWKRESAATPITLVLNSDPYKAAHAVTAADISPIGVAVRTDVALVPGQWVGVVPKGESAHAIPARVIWVREEKSGPWTVAGLEFSLSTEN